jgi:tRNA threonylcarbamoyladenosine biosynthesis protein TsaB
MTILLAIDTSASMTRVALSIEDRIRQYRTDEPRQAAQQLLPLIDTAFAEAAISTKELDGIAVVTGPGSFTGLRIGIGVAQGLSLANSTLLIGVSSLELLAKTANALTEDDGYLVCIPAREDEIYLGAYEQQRSVLRLVDTEKVVELNSLSPQLNLPERKWSGIGPAWHKQDQLETLLGVSVSNADTDAETSMEDLCVLGIEKLSRGETLSSEELLPNYVKERLDYS